MRQRFKARELWLLVPFLLIGVAALFYWRWEQITPADQRGLYVAKVEVVPATPREEEFGISHYITVTLSHSWPRPRWWGDKSLKQFILDPMAPDKAPLPYYKSKSDQMIAAGATLTARRAGKTVEFRENFRTIPGYISTDGENYVIKHPVSLRKVPPEFGEVKFEGLYQMTGTALRKVSRVVRAPGEELPPFDKNSGMNIVSVEATPWKKEHQVGMNNVPETLDTIFIKVVVEHTKILPKGAKKHNLSGVITDVDDEAHSNFGRTTGLTRPQDEPKLTLKQNQSAEVLNLALNENGKTKGGLTVKGKLWLDDRWPLPFELKLPPRPAATAPAK